MSYEHCEIHNDDATNGCDTCRRMLPWPKAGSIYEDDGPARDVEFSLHDPMWSCEVDFRVQPTKETGIHTLRTRFRVECVSCQSLLHKATTSPTAVIRSHVKSGHAFIGDLVHLPAKNLDTSNAHVVEGPAVEMPDLSFVSPETNLGPCAISGCHNRGYLQIGEGPLESIKVCGEHMPGGPQGDDRQIRGAVAVLEKRVADQEQRWAFMNMQVRARMGGIEETLESLTKSVSALRESRDVLSELALSISDHVRHAWRRVMVAVENRRDAKAIDDSLDEIVGKTPNSWKW